MYEYGDGGLAKDDAQAVYWYQKAADQGDADAKDKLTSIRAQHLAGRQ
jgi:TPR repeat protein